jgi:hypothetical protein
MEKTYDLKIPVDRTRELDLSRILNEEKLLHLHPHWFVGECQEQDNGVIASLKDYETENEFQLGLSIDFTASKINESDSQAVMRISLSVFAVSEILFFSENDMMRVKITGSGDVVEEEIEKSMFLWIPAIQEYIRLYTSNKPTALFFRMIMNKMILQMNPSQRKICIMLTKITIVEVLVILVIVVGYVFFVQ